MNRDEGNLPQAWLQPPSQLPTQTTHPTLDHVTVL